MADFTELIQSIPPNPDLLVLGSHFYKGGAERQLSLIAEALVAQGKNVVQVALAEQKPNRRTNDNLKLLSLGCTSFRSPQIFQRFWKLASAIQPRAVLSCVAVCDTVAASWCMRRKDCRWIMREANTFDRNKKMSSLAIRGWIGRFPDIVVSNNQGGFDYWNHRRSIDSTKLIPNILDTAEIQRKADTTVPRFVTEHSDYFVCVGRLAEQKNLQLAIRGFQKYQRNNPDTHLALVGTGSLEKQLKSLVDELHLNDHVHFLGYQENPYPLIQHARAILIPSFFEGLPNVAMESILLNTPILLSDISAHRFVFNEKIADYFSVDSPDELTQCMHRITNTVSRIDVNDWNVERNRLLAQWDRQVIGQQYSECISS